VQPVWISDHLCWTGVAGGNLHDLLPLPYHEAVLPHVVERVGRVQDRLGSRILLENASTYVSYESSQLTEWDFLAEVARRADCLILLDVNNVYVNRRESRIRPAGLPGCDSGGAGATDSPGRPRAGATMG